MIRSLPTISETIAAYGLGAKKSLGQNFILDLNLTQKIARQGLPYQPNELLMEIGPGPGALTRGILLAGARHLVALEKDQRCLAALSDLESASDGALRVLEGDALEVKPSDILKEFGDFEAQGADALKVKIIANLPYNISTELLMRWVEDVQDISGLVLMFQREVAERICARPNTKSYGRLSVLTQSRFTAKIAFDVPPTAFKPAPKVMSSIVVLKPKTDYPEDKAWRDLKTLTKFAFAQRRKMLRKTMKDHIGDIEVFLASRGHPETARAEDLSVADFEAMVDYVAGHPS